MRYEAGKGKDAVTILKFFKKYKGYWFNARVVSHELDIPMSTVEEVLTILVNIGLIEHDKEYFYRFKEKEQKMITAEEVRKYQKEQRAKISVAPYMVEIEEMIKENMRDLHQNGIIYEFKNSLFPEIRNEIEQILDNAGYNVSLLVPSHYHENGGLIINWRE